MSLNTNALPSAPLAPIASDGQAAQNVTAPKAPRKATVRRPKAPVVTSFTSESLAQACGAPSAKDFRRWLRATLRASGNGAALAGKGGRYSFTSEQGAAIVRLYGERKAATASNAAGQALASLASPKALRKSRKAPVA